MSTPPVSIHVEVRIKAPAAVAWALLADTSTWPDWNTFIPLVEPLGDDEKSDSKIMKVGSRRRFVPIINGKNMPANERVIEVHEPEEASGTPRKYRICWIVEGFPHFLFHTMRTNELEEVVGEDGRTECIYRTSEEQFGPIAYLVKMLYGKYVDKGIADFANDLKRAAEAAV